MGTMCRTKLGIREPLKAELAMKDRELVKIEASEKRVFEQATPTSQMTNMKGALSFNNHLVDTLWPPRPLGTMSLLLVKILCS